MPITKRILPLTLTLLLVLACNMGRTPPQPELAPAMAQQTESQPQPPPPPISGKVVNPADIEYLGAFRLPGGEDPPLTFAYGGNAMTFNPDNNTLFITGHDRIAYGDVTDGDQVAEVSIPEPVMSRNI